MSLPKAILIRAFAFALSHNPEVLSLKDIRFTSASNTYDLLNSDRYQVLQKPI